MTFLTDIFGMDDTCMLIIIAVAAYFLLKNGYLENIMCDFDSSKLVWVAAIGGLIYLYNKNGCLL